MKIYQKDFDGWNILKQKIHSTVGSVQFFHCREVWWCSLGVNIGFEQDGKNSNYSRPVVIVQVFNSETCLIVPLTSKNKCGRFYFDIGIIDGRQAKAVLSQIRFIDKKRLINKVDVVEKGIFLKLKKSIIRENFGEI